MEIIWYGQACFKIKGKNATIVIDPFDPQFTGLKLPRDLAADMVLQTHAHNDHSYTQVVGTSPKVFTGPGEYEIKGVSITGIQAFHDNLRGEERGTNTIYHILLDGISLVHLGDLGHVLTDDQLNLIDSTDILMVPVGSVYTIGAEDAAKVVSQLEPRIVIPMHYLIPGLKFALEGAEGFLKEMGVAGVSPQPKLSITKDKLPEELQVVVLSKI